LQFSPHHVGSAPPDEEPASLTTAQLAERTGVPAGTLRMWEARYGFPVPERAPGGRHRYRRRDAELIGEVLRLRALGLSTAVAIERARERVTPLPTSIFAGLRQSRPEILPTAVHKTALLEITHAIEDEYCARAVRGLLIASFQREAFYRQSERRWRELSRTAELALVMADFERLRIPERGPIEVPLRREEALAREWTLIVSAPQASACLAAWERPPPSPDADGERTFELLWSFEPAVVHAAVRIACALVERLAPEIAPRVSPAALQPISRSTPELRFAGALAQRIVGYLAREPPRH
jgi:DICT domain-containing protein